MVCDHLTIPSSASRKGARRPPEEEGKGERVVGMVRLKTLVVPLEVGVEREEDKEEEEEEGEEEEVSLPPRILEGLSELSRGGAAAARHRTREG